MLFRSEDKIIMEGGNIFSKIKDFFTGNKESSITDKFIEEVGDYKVISFKIHRSPVQSAVLKALNVLTLGKFDQYKYDQLYHLYMIMELQKGGDTKYILLEKRPRIFIEYRKDLESLASNDDNVFYVLNKNITFGEVMTKVMETMGENFNKYTPSQLNCQHFILHVQNACGTHKFNTFIQQSIQEIADKGKIFTDISNTFQKLTGQ